MSRMWIVALGAGISFGAQAADPQAWLADISRAARTANYEGVMIYRGASTLETFRVTHRFQDGQERERVQSLTGEPREILKQGDTVTCLLPKNRRLSTAPQPTPQGLFPVLSADQVARIAKVYRLEDLGQQRIAGRPCQGLAIVPRDQFRYGYEIWADAETRVPIKVTLRDHHGETLEQMMFTEVHFPEQIPDVAFEIPPERLAEYQAVVQEVAPSPQALAAGDVADPVMSGGEHRRPWAFQHLPQGFEVVMHVQRTLPGGAGRIQHWVLSDGLSAVSVFGREGQGSLTVAPRPLNAMGAVNAYRRLAGSMQITVVGEVPRETIKLIADGVLPETDHAVAEPTP